MCGLVGVLQGSALSEMALNKSLTAMSDAIQHRGPDGSGVWTDSQQGVGLGHRRLSIVDLSPHGSQPMISHTGRFVLAFNGEIYNHAAIRKEINELNLVRLASDKELAFTWRGHSDTEVMLAAFECWGIEDSIKKFNGMFGFAVWDNSEKILSLARDRFGEKPLYYGLMNGTVLFGSELKALKCHPSWHGKIDRNSLALYMRHAYVPTPYSIFEGVSKLPAGSLLQIPMLDSYESLPLPVQYWSAKTLAEKGEREGFEGDDVAVVDTLESLLTDAVGIRMAADVPLGAFLSGGIDSSLIVALMQSQSATPVKTFSIGFQEKDYNEAHYAKSVAGHLGTQHTELYVSAEEAMKVIPDLPEIYDEPFADSSQIPTFLVSKMTRDHVTVALTGDGGDELFGGYNRYTFGKKIWARVGWMPAGMRRKLSHILRSSSPAKLDFLFSTLESITPKKLRVNAPGNKIHKLSNVLDCSSPDEMYRGLVSFWDPASVVLNAIEQPTALTDSKLGAELSDFRSRMMFLDAVSYMSDDILAKVDRASMAVSLESRVPFLDHRVAEFAWKLPIDTKIKGNDGKWPLKKILDRYIPRELMERPKMGFGVPIDSWLRGPLREWAESALNPARLKKEGYLNADIVQEKWVEHLSGKRNWSTQLWCILMFQAWLEKECI
jgi:asparagine synthase (glutamine-hydrolysing)